MRVREAMSGDVCLAHPETTIREAARMMGDNDIGALPVADGDRLVGMITDRDIAVRAVGQGQGPDCAVRDVMTHEVMYCYDDEEMDVVAQNMADIQVRRLPVVNRDKRLVGILSMGDLARCDDAEQTGHAMAGVSRPGGAHSQVVH